MQTPPTITTIYHLEMLHRDALRPKAAPTGFEISMVFPPAPEINLGFYQSVGAAWEWTDRLVWSKEEWQRYADRSELETWIGKWHGQSVGYFELEIQDGRHIEIAYFGLLPEFIGKGLGGPLLTAAIQRAWEIPDTRRVWVHTCTKDHDRALDNYRMRGFQIFKTEHV